MDTEKKLKTTIKNQHKSNSFWGLITRLFHKPFTQKNRSICFKPKTAITVKDKAKAFYGQTNGITTIHRKDNLSNNS